MDTMPQGLAARMRRALPLACLVALAGLALAPADDTTLSAALDAERERPPLPPLERADFLVAATIRGPRLSPDGRFLAYLHENGTRRSLWWLATAGGEPRRLLPDTDADAIEWSRDGRWLFLESGRQLFALAVDGQPGSGLLTRLGGPEQRRVLAVDPVRPAAVLVTEERSEPGTNPRDRTRPTLCQLLRLAPGEAVESLRQAPHRIVGAAFDARGRLAFLSQVEGAEHVILRFAGDTSSEVARCTPLARSGCWLSGATADGRGAYVNSEVDGNLTGLLLLEADGSRRRLHVDPRGEADLDKLTRDPLTGAPLIASYRSTVARSYALDADTLGHLAAVERQIPGRDLRFEVGRGPAARWLISERDGAMRGERFHLYDPATGQLAPILEHQQPAPLPAGALATKIPFAYAASDGRRLHGFLLVPPGRELAQVPLVADVHGGPWSHVDTGYDSVAQFLVHRGYAVFKPNFRGSSGHGRKYLLAGGSDFGHGRVQQDIVDGVRYLLDRGVGDPARVGITGGSFGGYATLLGVTFEPELFKVGVALVPPSDFAWILRWNALRTDASVAAGIPLSNSLPALGLALDDQATLARLHAESPLAHAAELRRPLLLFAGGQDERVALRSVLHYAATLATLGKDVTLYVEPEAGHAIANPLTREAYLYLLAAHLHHHLGGARPAPPSQALAEALEENLRLEGSGR